MRDWMVNGVAFLLFVSVTAFHFSQDYLDFPGEWGWFPWITSLSGILALLVLYQNLVEGGLWWQEEKRKYEERLKSLQHKLEILSALREISLSVNEELSVKKLLPRIFKLTEVAFSPSRIAVFRVSEGKVHCEALWEEGKTFWGRKPHLPPEVLRQCIEHRRSQNFLANGKKSVLYPLTSDREVVGLLYLEWGREGFSFDENSLWVLSKHIALAVKKPDLYDRATVDPLTTLYTKGHFQREASKLFSMARRLNKPFSLILIDIDHFKKINDTYGHLTGDIVLHTVGKTIRESIRDYDSAYRYGGEEIAILLPETCLEDGIRIAERIRQRVERLSIRGEKGERLKVTLSAGVAVYSSQCQSLEEIISQADQELYLSKKRGRNQVHPVLFSSQGKVA